MSLATAIGQIDQVLQLQQLVADPASAAQTLSTQGSSAVGTTTQGGSGAATAFADMLAEASLNGGSGGAGLTAGTPGATTSTGVGDPISSGVSDTLASALAGAPTTSSTAIPTTATTAAGAPAQLQAMVDQANSLLGKPYVWGGGHSGWGPQSGYDCSGFVSAVLHAGGYLSAPQDTQTLPSQPGIETGPGQYVTIYDRTDAGSSQDHVIIDLGGQFYESGGGHGAWGGGGGVERIGTPSQAYLSSFNLVLHPEGM